MSDKWYEFEKDDQDRYVSVTLGLGDAKPRFVSNGSPAQRHTAKQALSAASDFYHLKKYDEMSGEGLFIFSEPKDEHFEMQVGYVAQWTTDQVVPKPNAGWAPLFERGNNRYILPFDSDVHRMDATAKYDAMDYLANGGRLTIRLFTNQGMAQYYDELWSMPINKAKKLSAERRKDRADLEWGSGRSTTARRKYQRKEIKPVEIPTDFLMPVKSGVKIDMHSVPHGWYQVVKRNGRRIGKEEWNGDLAPWVNLAKAGMRLEENVSV